MLQKDFVGTGLPGRAHPKGFLLRSIRVQLLSGNLLVAGEETPSGSLFRHPLIMERFELGHRFLCPFAVTQGAFDLR